jgi:hypothetical protein
MPVRLLMHSPPSTWPISRPPTSYTTPVTLPQHSPAGPGAPTLTIPCFSTHHDCSLGSRGQPNDHIKGPQLSGRDPSLQPPTTNQHRTPTSPLLSAADSSISPSPPCPSSGPTTLPPLLYSPPPPPPSPPTIPCCHTGAYSPRAIHIARSSARV